MIAAEDIHIIVIGELSVVGAEATAPGTDGGIGDAVSRDRLLLGSCFVDRLAITCS